MENKTQFKYVCAPDIKFDTDVLYRDGYHHAAKLIEEQNNRLNMAEAIMGFMEEVMEKRRCGDKPECFIVTFRNYAGESYAHGFDTVSKAVRHVCSDSRTEYTSLQEEGYTPVLLRHPGCIVEVTAHDGCIYHEWRLFKMSEQYVAEIMDTALECMDWCHTKQFMGPIKGRTISEQISHGGRVRLCYGKKKADLDLKKFYQGFSLWLENGANACDAVHEDVVDTKLIDGPAADQIIQYAVFGKVVYSH